jgi:tetratricopeptide (TPR) repeat protein
LGGEIAAASGRTAEATALLRRAAAAEDGLAYDEPSDWNLPVRHALGAVLLAAGRPAEAEAVYREDLRRNPENGWALKGLELSLRQERRALEAAAVERRFARAWRRADVAAAAVWPLAPAGPQTRSSGG